MKTLNLIVSQGESGERLDKAVVALSGELSRSATQTLIKEGKVFVNGKTALKSVTVKFGDEIRIEVPDPKTLSVEAEDIPLDIFYEDEYLLVVNKPKGMVVHPAAGNFDGTLVNALLSHCKDLSGINGVIRPGIVHRIDKDTSGLLVVAKTDEAHTGLAEQIKEHSFKREYRTVVVGNVKSDSGTIDAPIGRSPKDRKKQAVTDKNSKNAVTHYEVIERFNGFTYLKVRLETGRTHQIRVHMNYIGYPIVNDPVYGRRKIIDNTGQCLHAKELGFNHPKTGKYMQFTSELPECFTNILNMFKD